LIYVIQQVKQVAGLILFMLNKSLGPYASMIKLYKEGLE